MVTCAIIGATGAVGMEVAKCMHSRQSTFGPTAPALYASPRSAGKVMSTLYGDLTIAAFDVDLVNSSSYDYIFLAVSGSFSLEWAEKLTNGGKTVVIDNSSAFRYHDSIPLVVPEINLAAIGPDDKLIANPNCTTAIAAMALHPIHAKYTIETLIVSSYQATSGAGEPGMQELLEGTRKQLEDLAAPPQPAKMFSHPIAFNCIPCIDKLQDNGYTKEEMKVAWETRKIFCAPDMKVSVTAVRIPTLRAHSEAISIQTKDVIDVAGVKEVLATAKGLVVKDDTANDVYPMPLTSSGADNVEVGRIRQSLVFGDRGVEIFVCGDQLLRGAALNAVLIAEAMEGRKA
ncbi:hypothetical protein TeGR_g10882 [Tetraparma gracilis]|uniref:aspartate-semialdehyde dehydrogenase n=1 Tax=Tetraparma gracilis TaxID=2962635 RepID=A0ABQ6MGJ1_9STRA|nr:hypothetical protein TeGR_g10882 [Tetraparma gracilis]